MKLQDPTSDVSTFAKWPPSQRPLCSLPTKKLATSVSTVHAINTDSRRGNAVRIGV
jgi:hypothetical protein